MNLDLKQLFKTVSEIKLQGGIFAKASTVLIVTCVCLTSIAISSSDPYIKYGSIAIIFVLTLIVLLKLIDFANKNPQAAILEGAQFLLHEQIQLAAKGLPNISDSNSNIIEDTPIESNIDLTFLANQPEEEDLNNAENDGI
jgi:hypothetical protein